MFRRKPRLLVPIHDRRRRFRILTLKNFGVGVLVLIVVLVAANFAAKIADHKARAAGREYGRIVTGELPPEPMPAKAPPEVVTEGAVDDQTVADPMLTVPGGREQYLGVPPAPVAGVATMPTPATAPAQPAVTAQPADPPQPAAPAQPTLGSHPGSVTIVGDSKGVAIVTQTSASTPKLGGGTFPE